MDRACPHDVRCPSPGPVDGVVSAAIGQGLSRAAPKSATPSSLGQTRRTRTKSTITSDEFETHMSSQIRDLKSRIRPARSATCLNTHADTPSNLPANASVVAGGEFSCLPPHVQKNPRSKPFHLKNKFADQPMSCTSSAATSPARSSTTAPSRRGDPPSRRGHAVEDEYHADSLGTDIHRRTRIRDCLPD